MLSWKRFSSPAEYFSPRWSHGRKCWIHAKKHKAVSIGLGIFAAYSLYSAIAPAINLPDWARPEHWPKIPLSLAVSIIAIATLFMIVEGSYRLHKKTELPASRPKIYPLKYGGDGQSNYGLWIGNDGDPAFNIWVENATVGNDKLIFDYYPPISILRKEDGEYLVKACIQMANGSGLFANGLYDQMNVHGISEVSLTIGYEDGNQNSYATRCILEHSQMTSGGIKTKFVRQEIRQQP